jgi:glycosyltransferase involved in cell wall biosynthesis
MKTLGVSMIVRDESECIVSCLESVKDADEIVIVDTGSKDNTIELCKRYTKKVYSYSGCNDENGLLADFSDARNKSLSYCTADYVLIIDADEQLKDSIHTIKRFLNSGQMTKIVEKTVIHYMGIVFMVQTRMELVESCRVIKNDPSITWTGAVHNTLQIRGAKNNESLKAHCYKSHFAIKSDYSPAHFKDPDRSLRILTRQLEIDPANTRYMYYIAREYISRRMRPENKDHIPELLDKVIYWLEKNDSIAYYEDWTNEYADALFCLALAYVEKGTLLKDSKYWYMSVSTALRSFMILPSYKAPAEFLSAAMMGMPRGNKYPAAAQFWDNIAKHCTNAGVAQIREPRK